MTINVYTKFLSVVAIGLLILTTGCATKRLAVTEDDYSGFLGDYSKLERSYGGRGMTWVSNDFSKYEKVALDPVILYPLEQPGGAERIILLNRVKSYLGDGFAEAIKERNITLVTQPGEKVAKLRAAITGITSVEPVIDPFQYIPINLLVRGFKSVISGNEPKAVRVFLEAEIVDSQTGQLLAQVVKKGVGVQLHTDELLFDDIQPVLDGWIKEDAKRLAELLAQQ